MGKVVLANGCFDLFHYGHLLHLKAAKKYGDILIVSVTMDEYVNKGEGRPVFNQEERMEIIKSLRFVNRVILCESSLHALNFVRPHVFVKGQDYVGKISKEDLEFCKQRGTEIMFTNEKQYSSTELLSHESRSR
jgi:rfaE bifunctional protein nucleotidyltransferase chain/domain